MISLPCRKSIGTLLTLTCTPAFLLSGCFQQAPSRTSQDSAPQTIVQATEIGSIEQVFETAKQSRPQLIAFLRAMPKGADLHNHLWGTGFSELILQDAVASGYNYNTADRTFTTKPAGGDVITLDALKYDMTLFRHFREAYSARSFRENGGSGRDAFFSVFDRLPTASYDEIDMLGDAIRRAAAQNISYLELQANIMPEDVTAQFDTALENFDPDDLDAAYEQIKTLTKQPKIKAAISRFLDAAEARAEYRQNDGNGISTDEIRVNYLPFLLRHGDLRSYFLMVATGMTAINADERIVGMNIVAPEDHPDSQNQFEGHMRIIDFMWSRMGEPNMTLHAGELTLKDSNPEEMRDRIRKTIDIGHAKRIGHGVSIAWEDDVQGLLKQMSQDGILVEICLTSNEVILGVAYDEHPFELYRQYDVPLSLNTDDEGINRSVLTLEFVQAVERYDLSYSDVKDLARNSLEYSFSPGESLFEDRDYTSIRSEFTDFKTTNWKPSNLQSNLLSTNQKMSLQVDFEQRLSNFEAKMTMPAK